MKSVLGKLIQKEFGRSKYKMYCHKLDQKACMDIFCDIYLELMRMSEEKLCDKLTHLLGTVQLSVKISRMFFAISIAFCVGLFLLGMTPMLAVIKVVAASILVILYAYKGYEYWKNRTCDRDVKLVLIYKTALFHLLSEEGK